MGLADEIEAARGELYGRQGATCSMKVLLGLLTPDDRTALEGLLGDPRVFGTRITAILNSWGPKIRVDSAKIKNPETKRDQEALAELCEHMSGGTVQRHRKSLCHCHRGA